MNRIFKITVLNWDEHNPGRKKSYKKTLIANNFCSDAKIVALSMSCRWLFLALVLQCGEHNQDTVTLTEVQLNDMLRDSTHTSNGRRRCTIGAQKALESLKSFQLVTFEILQFFNNRIEKKRIEKEKKRSTQGADAPAAAVEILQDDLGPKCWDSYRTAYLARWNQEPVRNASVNSKIAQLAKRLGQEAPEVIKFYVNHNDAFYVKKAHPIGLCLSDAESLRTQWARGSAITSSTMKSFESSQFHREQIQRIERGEI